MLGNEEMLALPRKELPAPSNLLLEQRGMREQSRSRYKPLGGISIVCLDEFKCKQGDCISQRVVGQHEM